MYHWKQVNKWVRCWFSNCSGWFSEGFVRIIQIGSFRVCESFDWIIVRMIVPHWPYSQNRSNTQTFTATDKFLLYIVLTGLKYFLNKHKGWFLELELLKCLDSKQPFWCKLNCTITAGQTPATEIEIVCKNGSFHRAMIQHSRFCNTFITL